MKTLPFLLLITIRLWFVQSPTTSPDKVVANLYQQHAKQSPFFQTKNRVLLDTYFTKKLADLIWKDAIESKDEVGAIDGDPLYNAQDTEIKKFAIHPAKIQGNKATVNVTFENFKQKQLIVFLLTQEPKGWKIENIKYTDGYSLLKILQPGK
ncbi:hypothetical protein GCM10028805_46440 [Spirosoma harenae]